MTNLLLRVTVKEFVHKTSKMLNVSVPHSAGSFVINVQIEARFE